MVVDAIFFTWKWLAITLAGLLAVLVIFSGAYILYILATLEWS